MSKRVLVVGGGGREHALAWKIAQSASVERVYVAPGNGGTASEKKMENVPIQASDIAGLLAWSHREMPDLVVVGPDEPLSLGIVDEFQKHGLRIFGPRKSAARLEWSKSFAKGFFKRYMIPTAAYETFESLDAAIAYIRAQGAPIVVKADGLAAGKGVVVAQTIDEAIQFARECLLDSKFGTSGAKIVVEEFMKGEEASYTAIVDGQHFLSFPSAQDHKRIFDGDKGPNTGGMGTYSPAPIVTPDVEEKVIERIVKPVIASMKKDGVPFVGFLYVGLMIHNGEPRVVEINARFGDPETQPIMMRLTSDLYELIEHALDGTLDRAHLSLDSRSALCVVAAAKGYPGTYAKGEVIRGLDTAFEDVKVFHAGTILQEEECCTNGGRVLGITALGESLTEAQRRAYDAIRMISFQGMHYRNDIGDKGLR